MATTRGPDSNMDRKIVYRKKFFIIPRKSTSTNKWLIGWIYTATRIINYDHKGHCILEDVYNGAEEVTYQVMSGQAVIRDFNVTVDNTKYTLCFLLWPRKSNFGKYVWGKSYYSIDEKALNIGVYVKEYHSLEYITNLVIHSSPKN